MTNLVLCENGFRHYDGFFSENLLPAGEKVHFVAKGEPWDGPALQNFFVGCTLDSCISLASRTLGQPGGIARSGPDPPRPSVSLASPRPSPAGSRRRHGLNRKLGGDRVHCDPFHDYDRNFVPRGGGSPPPTKPAVSSVPGFVGSFCRVCQLGVGLGCSLQGQLRAACSAILGSCIFSQLKRAGVLFWGPVSCRFFFRVETAQNAACFFFLVFWVEWCSCPSGSCRVQGFLIAYFFGELVPSLTPTMGGYVFLARNNGIVYAFCTLFSLLQQSLSEITVGFFPDVLALRFLSWFSLS